VAALRIVSVHRNGSDRPSYVRRRRFGLTFAGESGGSSFAIAPTSGRYSDGIGDIIVVVDVVGVVTSVVVAILLGKERPPMGNDAEGKTIQLGSFTKNQGAGQRFANQVSIRYARPVTVAMKRSCFLILQVLIIIGIGKAKDNLAKGNLWKLQYTIL
jgi:hypothetical protein